MAESRRYQYVYAIIDPNYGNMCVEVRDTTREYPIDEYPTFIPIPTYNENYIMKYYNTNTQKWYTDFEFTNEWIPS